jgi:zinc protease
MQRYSYPCLARFVICLVCAGSAFAAPQAASQQHSIQKAGTDPVVVRETGSLPSYKDLKYPPLGHIEIPKPEVFTLSNGMKVYLLEDHELPLVSGRVVVRTGNLFDPKNKLGLAEITGATLRSGGTQKLTGDQLDETLENMAASIESGIAESSGSAGFSCLKENTDAVLALFRDVLTDPAFSQDKIDLIKTQINSSLSRQNDDAPGIAQRELYRSVYGRDTPYGGQETYDTVNAVTRADVVAFYKRYFFPSNMILSVYGDFDSAAMKQKLEEQFGPWKVSQSKVPAFPKVDASPAPGVFLVSKKDVTQTFIDMGELGGQLRDKDFPALSVAADVFGGGFSSRLFREIRTRLGYAYSVGAGWGANYDHPGVFRINVSTKAQTTTASVQAILKVLGEMRTSEITDEELKVSKDSVLNSLVFAFERPSSTLNRLVTYDYFNYPADFLTQYQNAIKTVTKADVLRVAKEYFQPSKLTIIAVGNETNFGEPLTALNLPVKNLDVSVPPPHQEAAKADATSLAKGHELLGKAIAFLGGAAKLNALHDITRVENAQMQTPQGPMDLKVTSRGVLPNTFREDQQRGPVTITIFVDANSGWVSTPKGVQDLPSAAQQQIRSQLNKKLAVLMSVLAKQQDSAVDTGQGQIQVKGTDSQLITLKISESTGAIDSLSYAEEDGAVTENFSDWRDVNGVKFPFKTELVKSGKPSQSAVVTDLKINTNLKPAELSKRP